MKKTDAIAVFDSGVGGISVLGELRRLLPGERYLYFGDSANAPYGTRPTAEVQALTFAAVERLLWETPLKALVIACNTATAAAVAALRQKYPELIIIGIEPALKLAASRFPGGNIGIMATEVTLREEKLGRLMGRVADHCQIQKIPAPGLVELVEQGLADSPQAEALLSGILGPYVGKLDALVLGCTHYPFASKRISAVLGPGTALIDGGAGTARETQRRLAEAGLVENGSGSLTMTNSSPDPEMLELSWKLLHTF